jgi:cytochrome c biogenesis protein CcmG/thiol:disulfide interchange protein DsbE
MRRFTLFAVFGLLLLGGCDRGAKPDLVGKPAPDFMISDEDRTLALQEFRGKVVVLNFWASWCPPCIEETPSMIAMQQKMKGRITILAVSTDADRAAYLRFLREQKTNFLTVRDADQKSNRLYGTFAYPESYIIDANGVIRRKVIGPIDWTSPDMINYLSSL